MPGVVRVFTAADVPGALRVGLIHKDWPIFIPEGGRTSYLGDVLAIVVADDRETARAARRARRGRVPAAARRSPIRVAAIDDRADDAVWGLDGNVLSRSTYARGDVDAALAASAHVVHEVFQTQRIEHAFLEPESTLVVPVVCPTGPMGCTCTRAARASGTTATRSRRCSASTRERVTVELVVERRRVRRQGGHVQPGPDRAGGVAARAAR